MSSAPKKNPWIPQYKPNPEANLRLFCFPHAGGTTYTFRQWSSFLPKTVELCSIELPGRFRRINEPPYQELNSLVSTLSTELIPYFDKPFAFFGHSMGGFISFELTCLLRKQFNQSPLHLFVSGCRAVHLPNPNPIIHNLDDEQFIRAITGYGGIPQEVLNHREMMELLLPALKADFTMFENYVYDRNSPLDIPITVFGGKQDPIVSQAELEAWQEHTSADFSLYMFEGKHFFLEEQREKILERISSDMANYNL
ncbi:MAG: thioesterase II family protein [Xenococcaceae cyanobacterium]